MIQTKELVTAVIAVIVMPISPVRTTMMSRALDAMVLVVPSVRNNWRITALGGKMEKTKTKPNIWIGYFCYVIVKAVYLLVIK